MTSPEGAAPKKSGLFEDLIEVLYAPSQVFDRTRAVKAGKYVVVTAIAAAIVGIATKNLLTPWFDAQADLTMKLAAAKGQPMPDAAASSMRTFTSWRIIIGAPIALLILSFIQISEPPKPY